jgi:hypothetical protein
MNDVALQKEIKRIADELRLSGEFTESRFIEMKAEVDRLKLEIAALTRFLERTAPSFSRDFPAVREQVFQEVDPEME